jgi:N-acetylglutamate synthase-like GNAT family acetyltransferase
MSVTIFPNHALSFRLATHEDVPAILALIEKVRENLKEAEQHFLKEKTAEELFSYISQRFPTVLAFKDNILAGIAISTPQDETSNLGATNLPEMFNKNHYMCISTVAVDPALKGQGLGQYIVAEAFQASSQYIDSFCGDTKLCGVLAKVSQLNIGSQKSFLANGFNQSFETYSDPDGGYDFSIFNKSTSHNTQFGSAELGMREQMAAEKRKARLASGFVYRG